MAVIVTVVDLPASVQSAELVQLMVDGANAKASRVAPCLASTDPAPSPDLINEAKLVLVGAIKRWAEAGAGSVASETTGPYTMTVDTRQKRTGYNLWPSEIEQLQDLCKGEQSGVFAIDTAPCLGGGHLPWCSWNFGATYCSCGADLSGGVPLYEGGILSTGG